MKYVAFAVLFLGAMILNDKAYAGADDTKWVTKCLQDNTDAKVSVDVVTKYCTCMNNKMDENETRSINTWEKSHPKEQAACDAEAGWTK
ncbi:MAG: hypothetical protein HQL37_02865 [Alphaproteobacteria bacterium]|nr:hypothetical protein [Alphaproteobacteria bacterium]